MGNKTWELINSELTMNNVGFRKKRRKKQVPIITEYANTYTTWLTIKK